MKRALYPFIWLSVAGLCASILVHVSVVTGIQNPLGGLAWALHGGIFVVWLPAVFVAQKMSRGVKRSDFWKAILRGCPTWMKRMALGFFGYAIVNFVLFAIVFRPEMKEGTLRAFSGHWMAFYSAALAVLYSASRSGFLGETPKCPLGHEVSPFAKFCEKCGNPIEHDPCRYNE